MKEKVLDLKGTKVRIIRPDQPKKEDLTNVYDAINAIAKRLVKEKGIDISHMFYTQDEINKLKQSNSVNFL